MQALFEMEFSLYKVKITLVTIIFELFSNLIPIQKNVPPILNKGFIEASWILDFVLETRNEKKLNPGMVGFFLFCFFFSLKSYSYLS